MLCELFGVADATPGGAVEELPTTNDPEFQGDTFTPAPFTESARAIGVTSPRAKTIYTHALAKFYRNWGGLVNVHDYDRLRFEWLREKGDLTFDEAEAQRLRAERAGQTRAEQHEAAKRESAARAQRREEENERRRAQERFSRLMCETALAEEDIPGQARKTIASFDLQVKRGQMVRSFDNGIWTYRRSGSVSGMWVAGDYRDRHFYERNPHN